MRIISGTGEEQHHLRLENLYLLLERREVLLQHDEGITVVWLAIGISSHLRTPPPITNLEHVGPGYRGEGSFRQTWGTPWILRDGLFKEQIAADPVDASPEGCMVLFVA